MFRLIHLISLSGGIFAFLSNIFFGLYIIGLKLSSHQIIPFLLSFILLLFWLIISFFAYFLVGIATFSDSDKILDRLTPSLIVLGYMIIGLVVFWTLKMIDNRT